MTRDELESLPLAMQVRVLLDLALEDPGLRERLAIAEAPRIEFAPKYDCRIRRKDGICWASEYDLQGLRFWLQKAEDGAASGSQWAEKDRKQAAALTRFAAWREQNPGAQWTGVRGDDAVTAAPPSSRPTVYPMASRRQAEPQPQDEPADDDRMPF